MTKHALAPLGAVLLFAASPVLAQDETIRVGVQPWLGYGPLWVADARGFFEANGLDVELSTFNWDQDVTAALASGSLDVTVAATNTVIALHNRDVGVKGFLVLDVSLEADAILSGPDVASIEDLRGRAVAFEAGSTSDLLLNDALRRAGMTIADVEHVPMGASEAGLALISGQVDAAVTYEPYISAALAQGDGHKVLATAADRPGLISDMMVATDDWLAAHPGEAQALIRSWNDAVEFIRANPEEGGTIIAKAVGSPMEEFTPAFAGVRLYTIEENVEAVAGDFPATVAEIGSIMQSANPEAITVVPAAEDIMSLDALNAVAAE